MTFSDDRPVPRWWRAAKPLHEFPPELSDGDLRELVGRAWHTVVEAALVAAVIVVAVVETLRGADPGDVLRVACMLYTVRLGVMLSRVTRFGYDPEDRGQLRWLPLMVVGLVLVGVFV
jgi:hypothetical protein